MPRVVFVNRYFHPDHSATSQIASDLAFHLASRGWEVTAVTSRQKYDDPFADLPDETVRGVRIERIRTTRFGRTRIAGRAIDYATFYAGAVAKLRAHRGAVVVAMTDPPLISIAAAAVAPRLVNWLQDLFPEVARRVGLRVPALLVPLRDWSLRRARRNVAISETMAARVPNAAVVHNWAAAELRPVDRASNPLRTAWGLGDAFVVGYSGNFGRVHEFETALRAIALLEAEQRAGSLRFLFTGGGARLAEVKARAGESPLFLPYQPRERLSESLSAADAHLVTLDPSLEGLVVPSKFYGALAVARPVIFVGAKDGELARMVEEQRCGFALAPGDAEGLARCIRELAGDPPHAAAMGERGLQLYRERFAPERAFAAWERILEEASA